MSAEMRQAHAERTVVKPQVNITPEPDTLMRGGLDRGMQLGWYRG